MRAAELIGEYDDEAWKLGSVWVVLSVFPVMLVYLVVSIARFIIIAISLIFYRLTGIKDKKS